MLVDDQGGTGDGIRIVNPDNPSLEAVLIVVQTATVVFEATAVSAEITPMVTPEVLPVVEAVSDVLIHVESAKNVSKSSNVIIDPPQIGDE